LIEAASQGIEFDFRAHALARPDSSGVLPTLKSDS